MIYENMCPKCRGDMALQKTAVECLTCGYKEERK